jgi:hypothetical protein
MSIPDGITSVGVSAFRECYGLTSMTIPAGVTNIGSNPFDGCSLEQIDVAAGNPVYEQVDGVLFDKRQKMLVAYPGGREDTLYAIPEGTLRIGESAFSNCNRLEGVIIPGSVAHIGDYAFWGSEVLSNVTLSEGVADIGYMAFYGKNALTSVAIPDSVIRIGDEAFSLCSDDFTLSVTRGSYAEQYAQENEIPYEYIVD